MSKWRVGRAECRPAGAHVQGRGLGRFIEGRKGGQPNLCKRRTSVHVTGAYSSIEPRSAVILIGLTGEDDPLALWTSVPGKPFL